MTCEQCEGTTDCWNCDGNGRLWVTCNLGGEHEIDCDYCSSTGVCSKCGGSGEQLEEDTDA